jgi:hypothetical protein
MRALVKFRIIMCRSFFSKDGHYSELRIITDQLTSEPFLPLAD